MSRQVAAFAGQPFRPRGGLADRAFAGSFRELSHVRERQRRHRNGLEPQLTEL